MNSQFTFDNSLGDEILTVEAQCNGLHLEHKVEELDSPGHKGSFDNYFLENDLQQDTSDFWDNPSSDKVITELQPEEVRWFYKSYSNKRWIEFCGCDSLNIEAKYQQHFNGDWKFYISKTKANTELSNGDSPDSPDNSEREKYSVVVRGGLYEVELLEKQCVSIYWPGEQCMITRGSWFYQNNGQPFDADTSDVLEQAHLELYAGHNSSEYVIDVKNGGRPPVSHTENFPDSTVMWYTHMKFISIVKQHHPKL